MKKKSKIIRLKLEEKNQLFFYLHSVDDARLERRVNKLSILSSAMKTFLVFNLRKLRKKQIQNLSMKFKKKLQNHWALVARRLGDVKAPWLNNDLFWDMKLKCFVIWWFNRWLNQYYSPPYFIIMYTWNQWWLIDFRW